MQNSSIELKSSQYVLTLVMDPSVPFEKILADVKEKFTSSARFFRGAQMALGLICFQGRPLHAAARKLQTGFVEKTGGQICREIKGIDTGKMLCPCEDCIRNAVTVLEASLEAEA